MQVDGLLGTKMKMVADMQQGLELESSPSGKKGTLKSRESYGVQR
jgi:hypothetical protein